MDRLQILTNHDFTAPAEALWSLLEDFSNIERWWPKDDPAVQIALVELEGEGVGMVRHIHNRGFPAPVSERLDFQDAQTLTYRLSIVGNRPAGITEYQATGWVERLSGDCCRLHYRGEFSTVAGREEDARTFLCGAYALMFKGLTATLSADDSSRQPA